MEVEGSGDVDFVTPPGASNKIYLSDDPADTADRTIVRFKNQEDVLIGADDEGCYRMPKFVELKVTLNSTSEYDLSDIVLQLKWVIISERYMENVLGMCFPPKPSNKDFNTLFLFLEVDKCFKLATVLLRHWYTFWIKIFHFLLK